MGQIITVGRVGHLRTPAAVDRRRMTPITLKQYRDTFRRPANNDRGETRREMWGATSKCRRWRFERQDDGIGSLWSVTYVPTGQVREGFGNLNTARRDAAAGLLGELRAEAFVAGLRAPIERRRDGQRWIAVHMRLSGADEAEARCVCGGLLVRATRRGDLTHVDGCALCYVHGQGLAPECTKRREHLFCATPIPVECSHWMDRPRACGEPALPNAGRGCGLGKVADCCTACCNGE